MSVFVATAMPAEFMPMRPIIPASSSSTTVGRGSWLMTSRMSVPRTSAAQSQFWPTYVCPLPVTSG